MFKQSKNADDKAYVQWIYRKFRKLMFYTAKTYINDQDVCEDIVQQTILKIFEKIDVIREKSGCNLPGYIVSITRNTAIDYLRREEASQMHVTTWEQEKFDNMPSSAISPEDAVLLLEKRALLLQAIEKLPKEQYLLLHGRYFLDYSDEMLAKQLGCKESNIRMKLTRARRNACKILKDMDLEGDEEHDES